MHSQYDLFLINNVFLGVEYPHTFEQAGCVLKCEQLSHDPLTAKHN